MSSGPLVGWWEVLCHRISSNIWYIRLMTSGWVYGCMPSWTLYSWLIESPNNCGLPSSSCAFQEPILCFRHQYLEMVGSPPCEARPLQPPDRKKRLIYLELAQLLLRKYPSQSTQRSVQFLLLLCRNTGQQPLPRLPWLERAARGDVEINVDLPSLARLAPVMRFNARHRWKTAEQSHLLGFRHMREQLLWLVSKFMNMMWNLGSTINFKWMQLFGGPILCPLSSLAWALQAKVEGLGAEPGKLM